MPNQTPDPALPAHLPKDKQTPEEWIRHAVKAGISFIPFAGGPLAELIDTAWVPIHVKKMQQWYEYVDKCLKELQDQGKLSMEQLMQDEQFASLFQKTTKAYLDNVEAFKRPALRSALRASLTMGIPLDKKYIFLQMVVDLNETQLHILKDIYDNAQSQQYKFRGQMDVELAAKCADGNHGYLGLLKKGLEDYLLLGYDSADVVQNGANQWNMVPSEIGTEFIKYITTE